MLDLSLAELITAEPEQFGALDVFASFPCPLKVPMEMALQNLLEEMRRNGMKLKSSLDACNQLKYNDAAGDLENLEDLPEVIVTSGINGFLSHAFRKRFLETGAFHRWPEQQVNPRLATLELDDPDRHYRVIATNLFILAVDKSRIGSLPLPRSWADLLAPEYAGSTALCAHGDRFNESVLVGLHELYGDEGLRRFGRTVRYGMHPAQFVKHLGSGKSETPAIAIIPLFFAKTARNQDELAIVWPEDGALASPLFMMVKERSKDRLKELAHFFTGPDVSAICDGAFFPALHPKASSAIPENAPIRWLRWPYRKHHDAAELQSHSMEVFHTAHATSLAT